MTTSLLHQRIAEELGVAVPTRCGRPSSCSTAAPPCRSSPATARRPPACSTTRSCAPWRSGCATCGSWTSGARRSWSRSGARASSTRPWRRRSSRPTRSPGWRTSTCRTSRSGGPGRRSPARRGWSRWPRRCWPTRAWTRGPPPPASSTPTRASPTPPPRWRGRGHILIERFAEDADLIGDAARADVVAGAGWSPGYATARRPPARSSPTTSTSPSRSPELPSHRMLAMFRGEKEGVLDLTMDPESEPRRRARRPARAATRRRIAARFGVVDRQRPADRWLADTVRWAWRTRILIHLGADLRMRLWQAAEEEAVAGLRHQPARPAARRACRGPPDDGAGPGAAHRREGGGGRRHRQGRRHRHDLPARAAPAVGRLDRHARPARRRARRGADRDRQRHRLAGDRQARRRPDQAAPASWG